MIEADGGTAKEVALAALIRARYPSGGYPDPFNPDEDETPYEKMAGEVVAALVEAGFICEPQTHRECCRWCAEPAEVGGLCRPHFSDDTRMRRDAQRERQRITGFVDGELPAGPGFRRD